MDNGKRCIQPLSPSCETSRYSHTWNCQMEARLYLFKHFRFQKQLRSYIVIWLDKTSCGTSHGLDVQNTLSRTLEFVNTFDDVSACLDYVRLIQTKKIFFITSGTIGKHIISEIHEWKHISFIYIYCRLIAKHEPWAVLYDKICGVFDNMDFLVNKIKENIGSLANDQWYPPPIRIFTLDATESFWHLHTSDTKKLYALYGLALGTMAEVHDETEPRIDFLTEWEAHCIGNDKQLEHINDFYKNYDHPEKAVSWYTRDSFLYRLINKALRTRDIDTIYRYRYMITALNRHLNFLHTEFLATKPDTLLTVYRGQIMTTKDFEKLTLHEIIATNSYFSTTESLDVAKMYAGIDDERSNGEVSVVYDITVDITQLKKPFVKINNEDLSKMLDEQEVLFSVGTLFQIQEIEPNEKFYKVFLTSKYDDKELDHWMDCFTKKYQNMSPTILKLGRYLINMNQIDVVERFYRYRLDRNQDSKEPLPIMYAYLYLDLGYIYIHKRQYTLAKTLFEKSIHIAEAYHDEELIRRCYLMIDSIYKKASDQENTQET